MSEERIAGLLLGTVVGDALGLPREGLTPRRAQRLFGDGVEHALLGRRGMLSDDTDHTCMVVQAFLAARGDVSRFRRSLASADADLEASIGDYDAVLICLIADVATDEAGLDRQ